ncbi:MAG: Hpt domain-containing protein, partial [Desulfobacteraceae bacterium]
MSEILESINGRIESIALSLVTMEGEDIPVLGEMLGQLNEIEAEGESGTDPIFVALTQALSAYLERIILRETADLKPFEAGVEYLQAFCRSMINEVAYTTDLTDVFIHLGAADQPDAQKQPPAQVMITPEAEPASGQLSGDISEDLAHFDAPSPDLSDEDLEIFSGFVAESLDGLESIEIGLIDLEQNPDDSESINTIFRSFHTIKGVSGFLGLGRINKLAHRSENLLDKIRGNEISMDADVTDVILDSVDLLKQMVQGVQEGMDNGAELDIGSDIVPVVERIEGIQAVAQRGAKPIGEILVDQGTLAPDDLEAAVAKQKEAPDKKLGQILMEDGLADAKQVARAMRDQKRSGTRKTDLQVKVDTLK